VGKEGVEEKPWRKKSLNRWPTRLEQRDRTKNAERGMSGGGRTREPENGRNEKTSGGGLKIQFGGGEEKLGGEHPRGQAGRRSISRHELSRTKNNGGTLMRAWGGNIKIKKREGNADVAGVESCWGE